MGVKIPHTKLRDNLCHCISICFGSTVYTKMGQPRARGPCTPGPELRQVIYLLFNTIVYGNSSQIQSEKTTTKNKPISVQQQPWLAHRGANKPGRAGPSFVVLELGSFTKLALYSSSRSARFLFVRAKPCSFTKRAFINDLSFKGLSSACLLYEPETRDRLDYEQLGSFSALCTCTF